jgi:hypothetical protein
MSNYSVVFCRKHGCGDDSGDPGCYSRTRRRAGADRIGKDYPCRGSWFGLTPSKTRIFVSLGGYLGLTIGWVEGAELNFSSGVLSLDLRQPALTLQGIGRIDKVSQAILIWQPGQTTLRISSNVFSRYILPVASFRSPNRLKKTAVSETRHALSISSTHSLATGHEPFDQTYWCTRSDQHWAEMPTTWRDEMISSAAWILFSSLSRDFRDFFRYETLCGLGPSARACRCRFAFRTKLVAALRQAGRHLAFDKS